MLLIFSWIYRDRASLSIALFTYSRQWIDSVRKDHTCKVLKMTEFCVCERSLCCLYKYIK